MVSKANPKYLLLPWKLQDAFDLYVINPSKNGRVSNKKVGTVSKISHSEKAKVENKTDQAVFLVHTTSQEEGAAPFALQTAKLDYKGLRRELKVAVEKGLAPSPAPGVLARQSLSFVFARVRSVALLFTGKIKAVHSKWMADNEVADDDAEESEETLVKDKASEAEETDEEEADEEPESCAALSAQLQEEREAEFSLGSHAPPADDDVVLLPTPAPLVKQSPKDGKVGLGSRASSLKRTGSKEGPGPPPQQGSKADKQEAAPGLESGGSGKKNKRKRCASSLQESRHDADSADVPAPRKLKLAKTGLRERYSLVFGAPQCH